MSGRLAVVGLGPGDPRYLTPDAEAALGDAEALYGYGPYGPGLGPLFIYGMPLYRPYGSYAPTYVYRGLTNIPGRTGYGYGYGTTRSLGPVRPSSVGIGRPAIGGVHVGGHH